MEAHKGRALQSALAAETADDTKERQTMTFRAQVEGILDRRILEVSDKSVAAMRKGDDATMYRLNTAFHWLWEVRRDIAKLGNGETEKDR